MPTLADELVAQARQKIIDYQAPPSDHPLVKQEYLDLLSLAPAGIKFFGRATIDAQEFATTIDAHRGELRPWIMVYPAALGLSNGPWAAILASWADEPVPNPAAVPPRTDERIDWMFRGYVRWIAL